MKHIGCGRTDSVDAKKRIFVRLLRKRQIAKTFGINFKIYYIKTARKKDQRVHVPKYVYSAHD